ncbi:hypothetical protein AB1D50_004436 [Enterobacter hormaechei]
MFYNNKRRHGLSNRMSPAEYENKNYLRLRSIQITRGDYLVEIESVLGIDLLS